jgi:putative transposase
MARKRYKPEEIVAKLRQVDLLVSQGQNMVDAIRQIGVSEVTYYRWRQEFGGLKSEQVKRLKEPSRGNASYARICGTSGGGHVPRNRLWAQPGTMSSSS